MGKEKKEIGKLLELLNEYDPYIASDGELRDNFWYFIYKGGSAIFPKEIGKLKIISKEYGFISWLVQNDRIDLEILKDNVVFTMFTHCVGLGCEWHTVAEGESVLKAIGTDALIAYISIQDKPIEFLVSILK